MPSLGPLVPLFWISDDVSSGFQSQSQFCLIHFFAEVNVMYIPQDSTSGATCADLFGGQHTAAHFPTCMMTWLGLERAIAQTKDKRANIVPETWLNLNLFKLMAPYY